MFGADIGEGWLNEGACEGCHLLGAMSYCEW